MKQRHREWLKTEKGAIRKDWGGRVRIALLFPNRYSVGMSNLGFQSVYEALNRFDTIVCERFFHPEPEDAEELKKTPGALISIESQKPLRDFHLAAFSVPFENDYGNILDMLRFAGIPARSEQRTAAHPLVAAGGVALFLNPEPMAPFLDFVFAGEAEALIPDFLDFWKEFEDTRASRPEILKAMAKAVPGIYVPSLYEVSYRADGTLDGIEPIAGSGAPERVVYRRADLAGAPVCRSVILTPDTEFSDVSLVEIGRGCGRGCRFCAAGFVYRPVRFHEAGKIIEAASIFAGDTSRVGLVSAAVSDHPEIARLCRELVAEGAQLSFSSIRADSIEPEIASALKASAHHAVAIAPEAGTERLRRVINKNLAREQILDAAEMLARHGVLNLKLYFMIGLPTETIEDLEGIIDTAKAIKHHILKASRGSKRLGDITLSIHAFVPKPFTPFQWSSFAGVRELKEKAKWIRKSLQKAPNVRVHFDMPKWAYVQALLSRGDRRVSWFLERTALHGESWMQALRNAPHNPDFWVMRERDRDERFPWEIIDHGIRRGFLWDERQRALDGRLSPRCAPDEDCRRCGVCGP